MQRLEAQESMGNHRRGVMSRTGHTLSRGRHAFDQRVAKNPGASTTLSFVAGLGFGLLIGVLLTEPSLLRRGAEESWPSTLIARMRGGWDRVRPGEMR